AAGSVTTLQGGSLAVRSGDDGVFVGDAKVLTPDVPASNGIIHVIDKVLLPPDPGPGTIPEVAAAAGVFQTLLAAVGAAELAETLSGVGPFTVFAPTDDAFAALPEGTVERLLEDPDTLRGILLYHVADGALDAAAVIAAGSVTTLQGGSLAVRSGDDGVFVGDAKVLTPDVPASNGIIHIIDKVLLPPT
ncbi:MAG: fasciclin domain-containing protein, partial [Myxococcota bacterium]|nr:fasciclin domain-containing protein [Myxococcota bacterium]